MNWFDKWIYKQVRRAWENKDDIEKLIKYGESIKMGTGPVNQIRLQTAHLVESDRRRLDVQANLTFRMFRAENGYVMEVHHAADHGNHSMHVSDRPTINLHIIPDDADLGQEIAHILTYETLKVK